MSTTTATTELHPKVAYRVERKMRSIARFAGKDRAATPNALRAPYSHSKWRALTEAEALAHLRQGVEAQMLAAHAPKAKAPTPANEAPAHPPAEEASPAPAKPALVARYLVPCVAGCGTLHPARSAKPAVVRCGDKHRADTKREPELRSPKEISTERLIANYRRFRHEAAAHEEVNAPKPKRAKRKASCPNLPKPSADFLV